MIILLLGNLDFLSLQLSFPPLLCALPPASGQPGKFSGCLSPLGFRGLVKLRTYSPSLPVASLLPEDVIINHSGLQYPTPRNHLGNRLSFRLYGCIGGLFFPTLLVCNISDFVPSFGNLFHSLIATRYSYNQYKAVYFM